MSGEREAVDRQCPYRIKVLGREVWLHCKFTENHDPPHKPFMGLQTRGDRPADEPTEGDWVNP